MDSRFWLARPQIFFSRPVSVPLLTHLLTLLQVFDKTCCARYISIDLLNSLVERLRVGAFANPNSQKLEPYALASLV